jgi:hypothetical protein
VPKVPPSPPCLLAPGCTRPLRSNPRPASVWTRGALISVSWRQVRIVEYVDAKWRPQGAGCREAPRSPPSARRPATPFSQVQLDAAEKGRSRRSRRLPTAPPLCTERDLMESQPGTIWDVSPRWCSPRPAVIALVVAFGLNLLPAKTGAICCHRGDPRADHAEPGQPGVVRMDTCALPRTPTRQVDVLLPRRRGRIRWRRRTVGVRPSTAKRPGGLRARRA